MGVCVCLCVLNLETIIPIYRLGGGIKTTLKWKLRWNWLHYHTHKQSTPLLLLALAVPHHTPRNISMETYCYSHQSILIGSRSTHIFAMTFNLWPMNLTFNLHRAVVMTHTLAKKWKVSCIKLAPMAVDPSLYLVLRARLWDSHARHSRARLWAWPGQLRPPLNINALRVNLVCASSLWT